EVGGDRREQRHAWWRSDDLPVGRRGEGRAGSRIHAAADGGAQHAQRRLEAARVVGVLRTTTGHVQRRDPRRSAPAYGVSEHSVTREWSGAGWILAAPDRNRSCEEVVYRHSRKRGTR